ncbi:MAG: GAF domain-containing protein [Acidobacteriota bacterium]
MDDGGDYRILIQASLDGFWLVGGSGRLLDVNDAYCAMSGYTRAELLTMRIADLEASETPADITRHLATIKADGAARFETRHRRRDGTLVEVEVSAHFEAAQDRIYSFLRDITARRAADAALRERTDELTERVKELRCLLDLSTLTARRDIGTSEAIHLALALLPAAMRYPALATARLTLPDAMYATPGYEATTWHMVCDFVVSETIRGQLSVAYTGPPPVEEAAVFLPEERLLLEAVAQRLAGHLRRRRVEEALLLREMSLNSLLDLSQRASTLSERDVIQLALEEVERLTLSEIGYLHFVNPDQHSIQLFTWSQHTLKQCTAAHDAHYPLAQAGVWADCARWKRPVIHNDYQNCAEKKGYPAGHTHLVRHLSVPVVEDDSVKLILGVGNKPSDYDEADVRQLMLTAEHLWRIMRHKRAEDEARRDAERVGTLARVASRLNAHLQLSTVLQTVCEETAEALGFPVASVCLSDGPAAPHCHTATVAPHTGIGPADDQHELLNVLESATWIDDVFVFSPSAPRDRIGDLIAVRLKHDDRILGMLAVYRLGAAHSREAADAVLLRGLANQASQAIINARLFTEVSQSQEQLQALSRRLVDVQEGERRHIARELHDEVGQVLTAVKINLQGLRRQPAMVPHATRLDDSIDSTQRALEQVRNLSLDLRPSILDDLGLSAALEWHVQRLTQTTGLKPELRLPAHAPRWSPSIEITCFRVVQEALTNILRHAHAQHVWIDLQDCTDAVHLRVRDDGLGFDPAAARLHATRSGTSVGLLSMAERVALAGGVLKIESAPGHGTLVHVVFNTPVVR